MPCTLISRYQKLTHYHLSLPHLLASRMKSEHAIFSCVSDQTPELLPNFSYRFHVRTLHIIRKEKAVKKKKKKKENMI
jgi:hypothetical protein